MVRTQANIASLDPVWSTIRHEADQVARDEPLMASLVHAGILHHSSLERALSYRIAQKLASPEMSELILREIADEAYHDDQQLGVAARADILAVFERDPACHRYLQPLLFFKGFQALQCYRIGHWLWQHRRKDMAYFIQMRTSEVFGVDIHPGARMGNGIMIDHAHSIVIGETAAVGDNVSMLHSVTLGGTGKEDGDRHPKIGDGVLIGAGAAVLGNIRVGGCSRIAAGSVVLQDVPPCKTVAGVPAHIVGEAGCAEPSKSMNQLLAEPGRSTSPCGSGRRPGCSGEHRDRMLEVLLDGRKEARPERSVDHAVVDRERDGHHRRDLDLTGRADDRLAHAGSDREDGGVRRIDHRVEVLDSHHPQVRDREGAALVFLGRQLALARARRQVFHLCRER